MLSWAHESGHPHSRMPRSGVEWGWQLRSPLQGASVAIAADENAL